MGETQRRGREIGGTTYVFLIIDFFLVTRTLVLVMNVLEGIDSSGNSHGVVDCHLGFLHPHIQLIIFPPPAPEQIRQPIHLQATVCTYSNTRLYGPRLTFSNCSRDNMRIPPTKVL